MATYAQFKSFGPYFSGASLCTLKVYHYITGTTSLKDGYTTRGKAGTVAQPLTSDANGIAEAYWDGIYKFRIDGSTDGVNYSTLYTDDEVAVVDQSLSLSGEGAAISSAATLVLGTDGDFFHVTGATGPITALSGTQSEVTLVFDATPTLTHSGSLILQYGVTYTVSVSTVMKFVNEGAGVWREVSRTPSFVYDIIAAKGDLIVGTANDTASILSVGSNGAIPMARSAATPGLAYVAALNKVIYGLTYANNAGDAVNDLDIAAGGAMDATGAYWMTGPAYTKQSDAPWAVGTNAGMLDTGGVGNSDYYKWLIARSDTGVVDYICSLSSTAPTMPANYDFKRLIGWFKRVGGTIVAFTTYETEGGGLELLWSTPTLDIDLTNTLTTARRTDAVKVPLNFSVIANLSVKVNDAAALTAIIYCPDQTDLVPSATVAPLSNVGEGVSGNDSGQLQIRTSATGLIAARATIATIDTYKVATMGFTWARRN